MEFHNSTSNNVIDAEELKASRASFMSKVYGWMTCGLAITALASWWIIGREDLLFSIAEYYWFLLLAEIGLVMFLVGAMNRLSSAVATLMFAIYSLLNGVTLSVIFFAYDIGTVAATFGITAGTFAAMSIIGFVTKTDLTKFRSILMMGLVGIIIASIVNWFLQIEGLYWAINYLGVLIFVGLTAYDTQKIKNMAGYLDPNSEEGKKGALLGALTLYLDFINLFLFLLRILGGRK